MNIIQLFQDDRVQGFLESSGDNVIVLEPGSDIAYLGEYLERFEDAVILADYRESTVGGGPFLPRIIREAGYRHPLAGMVKSKDEGKSFSELKIGYLEQGADDLIERPANPILVKAVLLALTRRLEGRVHDVFVTNLHGHRIMMHSAQASVTADGSRVPLTGKEFALVGALMSRPGMIISKERFLDMMYPPQDDQPEMKIVDVFVCKVRKKFADLIGKEVADELIQTVWGRGYQWFHSVTKDEAK